jgi:hypothetical protein
MKESLVGKDMLNKDDEWREDIEERPRGQNIFVSYAKKATEGRDGNNMNNEEFGDKFC